MWIALLVMLLPSMAIAGAGFTGVSGVSGGGGGAMVNESSTVVTPDAETIEWVKASGDTSASRIGSNGAGEFYIDTDGNGTAECTFSLSGGVVTMDCNNADVDLTPGQTNGNIDLNDSAGTLCWRIDPDNGNGTQGTNCGTINTDGEITQVNTVNEYTAAAPSQLSDADCRGRTHFNNDADAITFTLPDGATGGGQSCRFFDKAGGAITIDVNDASEVITDEAGTALSGGEAIILAAGYGNWVILESVSATSWVVTAVNGDLTEETP